jgi:hypothetical protein
VGSSRVQYQTLVLAYLTFRLWYYHVMEWQWTGFGLVIGFIVLVQLVTTSKDYALTVLHTSQITIGHTRSPQSVTVYISHRLVAAFSGEHSPSSGFLNYPQPQVPVSNSNSSQRLNLSSPLINSITDSSTRVLLITWLLFAEPLVSNGCCIIAYFTAFA